MIAGANSPHQVEEHVSVSAPKKAYFAQGRGTYDLDGNLIKVTQVHGRKKSIRTMAEKLGATILDGSPIFISQADCTEDAEKLKEILKEEYGKDVQIITDIGSVIGAHAGPGTLALFFRGTER